MPAENTFISISAFFAAVRRSCDPLPDCRKFRMNQPDNTAVGTVQPVGDPDNACKPMYHSAVLFGKAAVKWVTPFGQRSPVVPDSDRDKNPFVERKRQCPVPGDEYHTGFVMGNIRDAPADVMQKCGRRKQSSRLPAAAVYRRKIVVDCKRQTADLPDMTEILSEERGRLLHDLQILIFQTTTRPFALQ